MKCPAEAIYVQILSQQQAENYFANNKNSDETVHINLIKDANDSYKQLLISVGEYVYEVQNVSEFLAIIKYRV